MYKAMKQNTHLELILDCATLYLYRVTRVSNAGVLTIGPNTAHPAATLH